MTKDCFDCKNNVIDSKKCKDCMCEYKDNSIMPSQENYEKWNKEKPNFEQK